MEKQTALGNHSQSRLCGARNQDRTGDLILTMDALYQLSYAGLRPSPSPWRLGEGDSLLVAGAGLEPTTFGL